MTQLEKNNHIQDIVRDLHLLAFTKLLSDAPKACADLASIEDSLNKLNFVAGDCVACHSNK